MPVAWSSSSICASAPVSSVVNNYFRPDLMPSCVPADWICFSDVCLGTVKGDTKQKCSLAAFAAWYPLLLCLMPQLNAHTRCSWSYIFLWAALPYALEVPISVAVNSVAATVCAATALAMLYTRVCLGTLYLRAIAEIVSEFSRSANASRTARRKSGPSYSFFSRTESPKQAGKINYLAGIASNGGTRHKMW